MDVATLPISAASRPSASKSKAKVFVVFRNDDPSAISDLNHEREIYEIFERYGARQTLAVIPDAAITYPMDPHGKGERPLYDNPQMIELLREHAERTGSEIALHGLTHRVNRFSIPERKEYSEFKYLPQQEQVEMIRKGVAILEKCFGARPTTFVPPWNRWDENTVEACIQNGITAISAGPHVSTRPGLASVGFNTDFHQFHKHLEQAKTGSGPVFLHLLFHSNTLTVEQKELLRRAVETASRDPECEIVTIKELADRFPEEVALANDAGLNIFPLYHVPNWIGARASIYLSALEKLRIRPLRSVIEKSKELFFKGDYSQCKELTAAIISRCTAIAWSCRVGIFMAGLIAGVLLGALTNTAGLTGAGRFGVFAGAVMVELIAVTLAIRRTIARDGKRELAVAGVSLIAGTLLSLVSAAFQ